MYSDASKNRNLGYGCRLDSAYTYERWEPNFIRNRDPCIEFLELYAVCVGVFTWSHEKHEIYPVL